VAVAAALVAALALAAPAHACTCPAETTVRERLDAADAAFIGRLTSVEERETDQAVYRYDVDQVMKGTLPGDTIEVRAARTTAQCGLQRTEPDDAVGVLVTRAGAGWASSLCTQVSASALLGTIDEPRGQWIRLAVGVVILGLVLAYAFLRLRRRTAVGSQP
jgi:hypothetical protein